MNIEARCPALASSGPLIGFILASPAPTPWKAWKGFTTNKKNKSDRVSDGVEVVCM